MAGVRTAAVRAIFYGLSALSIYAFAIVVLGLFAFYATYKRVLIDVYPVVYFQRALYVDGQMRSIWQFQKDCVEVDPRLVYRPSNGGCSFRNLEFDTRLNFDDLGRLNGVDPRPGPEDRGGIAVLGDSHAMGWGVDDDKTFSAILQILTKQPVYNLAVSSYGTGRELERLVVSGLSKYVSTIIIQYCDNDLGENLRKIDYATEARNFQALLSGNLDPRERTLRDYLAGALTWPIFVELLQAPFAPLYRPIVSNRPGRTDFSRHFEALQVVLKQYANELRGKSVLVFYSNRHGQRFRNFEDFRVEGLEHIRFVDLELSREHYFDVDDHPNEAGHRQIANTLAALLQGPAGGASEPSAPGTGPFEVRKR